MILAEDSFIPYGEFYFTIRFEKAKPTKTGFYFTFKKRELFIHRIYLQEICNKTHIIKIPYNKDHILISCEINLITLLYFRIRKTEICHVKINKLNLQKLQIQSKSHSNYGNITNQVPK